MKLMSGHAAERIKQRVGIEPQEADAAEIWRKIDAGEAMFIGKRRA